LGGNRFEIVSKDWTEDNFLIEKVRAEDYSILHETYFTKGVLMIKRGNSGKNVQTTNIQITIAPEKLNSVIDDLCKLMSN
jgi:hypothetical protein